MIKRVECGVTGFVVDFENDVIMQLDLDGLTRSFIKRANAPELWKLLTEEKEKNPYNGKPIDKKAED